MTSYTTTKLVQQIQELCIFHETSELKAYQLSDKILMGGNLSELCLKIVWVEILENR